MTIRPQVRIGEVRRLCGGNLRESVFEQFVKSFLQIIKKKTLFRNQNHTTKHEQANHLTNVRLCRCIGPPKFTAIYF